MRILGWILHILLSRGFAALLVILGVVVFLHQPWFWHVLESLQFLFQLALAMLQLAIPLLAPVFVVWAGLTLWRSCDSRT